MARRRPEKDEEALTAGERGAVIPVRGGGIDIDFLAGLLLGVALLTESTLIHGLEHEKAQAATIRFMAAAEMLMVFVFYFYRVWTRRPDAGQTVYLFCMLPFILTLVGVALWGSFVIALH